MSDLVEQAREAARNTLAAVGTDATPEHIAAMAWLDGYAAGHQDMTQYAIDTIRETEVPS